MEPGPGTRKECSMVLLVTAIALAFCILPVAAITITDDAGMTITFNATPSRIVSLSPSNTEILASLGLLDRVVGITDVCDYPPEVKNKTRIGGYSSVSIEKVAATRPDLVIASDLTPKETVARLREIGLPVVVVAPRNIDHMIRDIRMVGTLTGTESRAEVLAANLSHRIAATLPSPLPEHPPTIAHIIWNKPLYVSGNNTIQNDVIVHAGGVNVFADRSGWSTVSLEEFLLANPDIIIVSSGGGMDSSKNDLIRKEFMTRPQYASLSAVKNSHVYAVNADIISRAGPRIADATEDIARITHAVEEERAASRAVAIPAGATKTPGFTAIIAALGLLAIAARRRK